MSEIINEDRFRFTISFYRDLFMQELQKEIVEYLYENQVLTAAEYQLAVSYEHREDRIAYILDILPQIKSDKYNVFLNYIKLSYHWVWKYFDTKNGKEEENMEKLRDILDEGDVPALPAKCVLRKLEFIELIKYLNTVKRNEYVVVHGMRGCGKTTLVTYVLNYSNSLVLETFEKVFFITVGRDVDELTLQQELCSKLSLAYSHLNNKLPLDCKAAKSFLKERFWREEMKDALLILDNVPKASFVDAFDIGCKVLITTDDKSVMNQISRKVYYLKMSEGFTEEETLSLFSQSTGLEKLPKQARSIHAMCKGFPLTISLLASQLADHKEDVEHSTARWNIYLSKLKDGISAALGVYDRYRSEQVTLLYKAIGMRIDSLDEELRTYYHDFALFMKDVNIKPEVLSTLWDIDSTKDIVDIMSEFERKCLVTRAYNRKSYVYCIHDLLLDYLRRLLTVHDSETLHRRLIQKYEKKYGKNVNNFPVDDNYIFLYIGYHLKEANLVEQFPNVYLNLMFVEKKIMNYAAGAADLLYDFKKYKSFIAVGQENTKKYEDFIYFFTRVAACKSISNSDIIQFALCESKQSSVYKEATKLKNHNEESHIVYKYFDILTDAPKEDSAPLLYYDRKEIVASAFMSDNDIIVANTDGIIRRINIEHNCTVNTFQGHKDRITSLQLSKNNQYFLSSSDDATIRVWQADGSLSPTNSFDKPRTPSPQFRQSEWYDMWPRQRNTGESAVQVLQLHSVPIKDARFSNSGFNIVSTAADHKVIIWRLVVDFAHKEMKMILNGVDTIETKENMVSCCFSNDDAFVVCASQGGVIYIYGFADKKLKSTEICDFEIKSMSVISEIPHVAALVLGEKFFCVMDIVTNEVCTTAMKSKNSYGTLEQVNNHYICGAVSWDGKYIAIASTSYNILIYETLSGEKIMKFNETNGRISNLSWSRHNDKLLTSYNSQILKVWNVKNVGFMDHSAKLQSTMFDSVWMPRDDDGDCNDAGIFFTAAVDSKYNISVFDDMRLAEEIKKPVDVGICQICVSLNGDIIYCTKDGRVFFRNLENTDTRQIMSIYCSRVYKLKTYSFLNRRHMLVLLLAEKMKNELVLQGWCKTDEETEKIMSFDITSLKDVNNFRVDLVNNTLYVMDSYHKLNVYCTESGSLEQCDEFCKYENHYFKFTDMSSKFRFIASGNEKQLCVSCTSSKITKCCVFEEVCLKTCKFSPNEKYLVVGFAIGNIRVYDIQNFPQLHVAYNGVTLKFSPGHAVDIVWSSVSNRFIVIFDREISLYRADGNEIELLAVLYMPIHKLICNPTFNRSVTIDSHGYYRVLKLPL